MTADDFANPETHERWREEKQMVLKMWSDQHRETPLDIFVYEPFDFEEEYKRAFLFSEAKAPQARFASIPELIAMKRTASRSRDLVDIEYLQKIENLNQE